MGNEDWSEFSYIIVNRVNSSGIKIIFGGFAVWVVVIVHVLSGESNQSRITFNSLESRDKIGEKTSIQKGWILKEIWIQTKRKKSFWNNHEYFKFLWENGEIIVEMRIHRINPIQTWFLIQHLLYTTQRPISLKQNKFKSKKLFYVSFSEKLLLE